MLCELFLFLFLHFLLKFKEFTGPHKIVSMWCFSHKNVSLVLQSLKDKVDLHYKVLKEVTQEFHTGFHRKLLKHSLYTTLPPLMVFHHEQLTKIFFSPYGTLI